MNNATIATQLSRFTKSGDLFKYHRRIVGFSRDEKERLVENLEAGDDPDAAIRDARGYVKEAENGRHV